jgi:DnaJ-class molecular chaperone
MKLACHTVVPSTAGLLGHCPQHGCLNGHIHDPGCDGAIKGQDGILRVRMSQFRENLTLEVIMANEKGPNVKKKAKCKNCEGKGLLKKGDKVVKCQRCHGTGLR